MKKKIKYEIRKQTKEIKLNENATQGCTTIENCGEAIKLASYENKEEALKELSKYKSTCEVAKGFATTFKYVTEFYVEENEYDEDGEWVAGGDIWGFASDNFNGEE